MDRGGRAHRPLGGWLREYDATGLPEEVTGFLEFYEARRTRMRQRLASLLGAASLAEQEQIGDTPDVVPDDEPDPGNEGL
ncbi:hypothetical protein [Streptomyces sp. NPDC056291]|uniref:hypothetical protein n=1 Tax=Streptomyces sp. NPDC056291 TaxID=3345772 RepID=UPI0035D8A458